LLNVAQVAAIPATVVDGLLSQDETIPANLPRPHRQAGVNVMKR
jgi:hypothetical protein